MDRKIIVTTIHRLDLILLTPHSIRATNCTNAGGKDHLPHYTHKYLVLDIVAK